MSSVYSGDEKKGPGGQDAVIRTSTAAGEVESKHATQRVISRRQLQLYSIGGVIGTAVFVSIGAALTHSGPLGLLIAYIVWCGVVFCINEGQAEMVCALPIESAFSRFASRWVEESFGCAMAYNYALLMISLLVFEITAFDSVLAFWSDSIHPAIIPCVMLFSYACVHLWSAKFFAESEFWIVLFKILLMIGLFMFTLVTMCGGNPLKDAFGFRAWKNPGPFAEYISTGNSGRLQGFVAALLNAAFAVAGPDMISIIAGEAVNPRKVMPTAFKTVFYRLIIFFVFSALAVGILVPSNDPILLHAIETGAPGAGRSPYVAAMTRLKVPILPHIVNAGILTSIYSAGSAFFFNATRTLHALALDGMAPAFLKPTNRNGVPWVTCLVVIAFGCLSFLRLSSGANKVLDWFISISASCQLVCWIGMAITYIKWRKAFETQGFDRNNLTYRSWAQPYAAWIGLFGSSFVLLINGYYVFLNGGWVTADFIFAYFAPAFFVAVYLVCKVVRRTQPVKAADADLFSGLEEIERHEAMLAEKGSEKAGGSSAMDKAVAWIF